MYEHYLDIKENDSIVEGILINSCFCKSFEVKKEIDPQEEWLWETI